MELRDRRFANGEDWYPVTADEAREWLGNLEQAKRDLRAVDWLEAEERAYQASPEARAKEHAEEAEKIGSIRRKVGHSMGGHQRRASGLSDGRETEMFSGEQYAAFRNATQQLATLSAQDDQLARLQRRHQEAADKLSKVGVAKEPGPYDKGSPHSWVRDYLYQIDPSLRSFLGARSAGLSDMSEGATAERLAKHTQDVRRALIARNKYGKRIAKIIRESRRQEDPILHERLATQDRNALRVMELQAAKDRIAEARAGLTTSGGVTASASGGGAAAFVPPAFLLDDVWAPYRSPYASFIGQCNTDEPLPDYGMQVYLTVVTLGTTVTTQVEGSGVAEGDPVASLGNSPIVMKAGQIACSQQFLDRAGPGISGDQVLFKQIGAQLAAQVDLYALQQAIAGAATVSNAGAFALASGTAGVGGFMGDLKKAKSKLTDTAGVRLRGTHCFALDDFVDYLGAYNDAQGRPVFTPTFDDNRPPIKSVGDQGAEGYSGYVLSGLALFGNTNIPNSGSNVQIVVCRPDTILQLSGAPIPYLYPPAYAGNLMASLGVRHYVATVARFPSGVAVISGAAYAAATSA